MTATDAQSKSQSLQQLIGGAGRGSAVERLPMLRVGLEKVGQACAEDLRNLGSVPMKLVLQGIESGTAGELLAGERGTSAISFLDAPGWAARLVVCAPRATILNILESLLGGDGSQPTQAIDRPLSKIEVGIAGVFFASIV